MRRERWAWFDITPPIGMLIRIRSGCWGFRRAVISWRIAYYIALKDAGDPVEMHLYAQGGHAFGLHSTNLPIGRWPALVEQWLHTSGMLGP